jgi:putative FmdB family regulatory protein
VPVYKYECDLCGVTAEIKKPMKYRRLSHKCPICIKGQMRLVPSLPADRADHTVNPIGEDDYNV